jgi:hypothetical protein
MPLTLPITFCGGLMKSCGELVMHRDAQLLMWMMTESVSKHFAWACPVVLGIRQTVAAVLNQANIPILPIDLSTLTRLWIANLGLAQVIFSFSVGSFPMRQDVDLSMQATVAVYARLTRSLTLIHIPRLCRRFHLDAERFAELVLRDSSGLLVDVYSNQPRTTWTQNTALGMQNSRAFPMYSRMRRYMAHHKKVGEKTAVLWPTPYSTLSLSEETSMASSWMAWRTLVSDTTFTFAAGVSFPFVSRRSHLFG